MLRIARHTMLVLSLLALLAILYIVNNLRQLDVYEKIKLPGPAISGEIQKVDDFAKLKAVCVVLSKVVEGASAQRRKDYDDLTELTRRGPKLALGFSVASVVVLLVGWAAGGILKRN